MAYKDTNIIGDVGECTAFIRLSQNGIFRVYLLGGKTPSFDLLVELNDNNHPYPFLVQVKATVQVNKYTTDNKFIKTPVPTKKYHALLNRPLPTYIAGLDIDNEVMFLYPAYDPTLSTNKIATTYRLSKEAKKKSLKNLQKLKDDVVQYWTNSGMDAFKKTYTSKL